MSALALNKHTPVDATAGTVAMTLPAGAAPGSQISVEKVDSSSNTVTVTGSVRGVTATLSLSYQYESLEFIADAAGSWRPIANHLPKASIDGIVAALLAAGTGATAGKLSTTYVTYDGAHLLLDGTVIPISGGGGGSAGVEYPQASPASTWGPINHGLGRRPLVTVFDANGDEIAPDIHATTTTVSLVFATPVAGTAVLI